MTPLMAQAGKDGLKLYKAWSTLGDRLLDAILTAKRELRPVFEASLARTSAPDLDEPQASTERLDHDEPSKRRGGRTRQHA